MEAVTRVFALIPAIDLRDGRVVRLEQGDFDHETVFEEEPGRTAERFVEAGATLLHVVDLDGARAGEPVHLAALKAIVAAADDRSRVEAGGGIRTTASVDAVIAAGADRVVFGTAALRDPGLVRTAVAAHGAERVAVAVDVRGGEAVGDAWQRGAAGTAPEEVIRRLADVGVAWFEVTAIERDGLGGGPDLGLLQRMTRLELGNVIASGGIRDLADIAAVRHIGCTGAIVGRAIYDGTLDLAAAVRMVDASR
jgi:phosphoribosylformimino-5-aminoimidazole carboxamide ribotide isomerase